MNELVEKYQHAIKYLFVPYIILLFLLFYPLEYYVQSPGGLTEVEKLVEIEYHEDKESAGSISTTFVMGIPRPTIFQFLVGYFNPYSDLSVLPQSYQQYTPTEVTRISSLDKDISLHNAVIVAYRAMMQDDPAIVLSTAVKTVVFGKSSTLSHYDEIAFGDEFVSVVGDNDVIITTISGIGAQTTNGNDYAFTFRNALGETYTLNILKQAESGLFGITFKTYESVDPMLSYPFFRINESNIGGPSGGLLQTLAIYDMLTDEDITHGLKIAGTGTINSDGTSGYIGGVKQKIITAYENKVDVFFIPYLGDVSHDNYLEAVNVCEAYGISHEDWLIPIQTFQDVLDFLETQGGAE